MNPPEYSFKPDIQYTQIDNDHGWIVTCVVFHNGIREQMHELGKFSSFNDVHNCLAEFKLRFVPQLDFSRFYGCDKKWYE